MANRNKQKEKAKLAFVIAALLGVVQFLAPGPIQAYPHRISPPTQAAPDTHPDAPRIMPEEELAHTPPQ